MSGVAWLLVAHGAATWALVGLIWMVQRVHYPLLEMVEADRFVAFEAAHQKRITPVVGSLMVVEAGCAAGLLWVLPGWATGVGMFLLLVVWGVTAGVSVPCHRVLAKGYDGAAHRRLVRTNWWRTAAWTARGALAGWLLLAAL